MRAGLDTRLRWGLAVALSAAALAAWTVAGSFGQSLLAEIAIFALFAMALDLAAGLVGLMSLGHALYFGLGAYGLAVLTVRFGLPAGASTVLCVIIAGAAGAAVGRLIVRFSEVIFITLTLAFSEMFYAFVFGNRSLGGSDGISGVPRLALTGLGLDSGDPKVFAALTLGCAVAGFLALDTITRSPFGLVAAAIRQNPARAQALGAPLAAVRTTVYAISAALTGLAGALIAQLNGFVSPDLAGWSLSGLVLIMAILGGLGSVSGAAFGAVLVQTASHYVSRATGYWGFYLGLLFIAVVLFAENGLFAILRSAARAGAARHARRRPPDGASVPSAGQ